MSLMLSLLPGAAVAAYAGRDDLLCAFAGMAIVGAEAGRIRGGASAYFSLLSSVAAPLWILERALCAWLAVAVRLRRGGIHYAGARIRNAATPMRLLANRHGERRWS